MVDYFPTLRELRQVRNYHLDQRTCLSMIWTKRYGQGPDICPRCGSSEGKWYQLNQRLQYVHSCGFQISPLRGTIFEKSSTPLPLWFGMIYDIMASDGKIPAQELKRRYEVSGKTGWRMKHQILDYLNIQLPKFGGFSYRYSSLENGRHHQVDYIAKHNLA